jgi:hypothetical protein
MGPSGITGDLPDDLLQQFPMANNADPHSRREQVVYNTPNTWASTSIRVQITSKKKAVVAMGNENEEKAKLI